MILVVVDQVRCDDLSTTKFYALWVLQLT